MHKDMCAPLCGEPPCDVLSCSGVAVIDNLVYAVGGSNRDDGTRSNLNSMERYNPERDEWEEMPPMHRSRGAASVTALDGCLYAVGGYDSGELARIIGQISMNIGPFTVQTSLN